jgi:hypothetical protein
MAPMQTAANAHITKIIAIVDFRVLAASFLFLFGFFGFAT